MVVASPTHRIWALVFVILSATLLTSQATNMPQASTTRSSNLPKRGPLPSQIAPSSYKNPSQKSVEIPNIRHACGRKEAPKISLKDLEQSMNYGQFVQTYRVDRCHVFHYLRIRLLRISAEAVKGKSVLKTHVRHVRLDDYFQNLKYALLSPTCIPSTFYIEACGRHRTKGVLCATSKLFETPDPIVPEARLAIRPPIELRLSPGGSALLQTRITKDLKYGEGFSNGGYQTTGPRALQMFAVSSSGQRLASSRQVVGTNVSLVVGGSGTSRNGSTVFSKYALKSCRSNSASWRSRYSTRIVVSKKVSPLVRQDSRVPDFKMPIYPKTNIDEFATLKVSARNKGDGKRADGSVTEMHYQWYVRNRDYGIYEMYAETIKGATKASLRVKADCVAKYCGRYGCSNLRIYFVDVCNTFGCRRSGPIKQRLIPPPLKKGENWNAEYCEVDKKGRFT